ncbi:MAG: hypothetical protein Q8M03_10180 [Legionella sp.]|nr:hypothetical protein [Legionella sp.]
MKESVVSLSDIQEAFNLDTLLNTVTLLLDTNDDFLQLAQLINTHKPVLPFSLLRLNVSLEMLGNEGFREVVNALNHSSIHGLQLVFPTNEISDKSLEISDVLSEITTAVNYPIVLVEKLEGIYTPICHVDFNNFQDTIIRNIQEKNWSRLLNGENIDEQILPVENAHDAPVFDQFSKKIKLKELINARGRVNENYNNYIKLEVQSIEVVQQQIEEVVEAIEIVEQVEQQVHEKYNGELIGHDKFYEAYHEILKQYPPSVQEAISAAIQTELFGNIPHAIKFLTPTAAREIANNYPNFAFLNKENLPQQFLLKKTDQGEFVLDFDPFADARQTNVFTPKPSPSYEKEPIYSLNMKEKMHRLISNPSLRYSLYLAEEQRNNPNHPQRLINLWIKYGDRGIKLLSDRLDEFDAAHPGYVPSFLFNYYLVHFSQWDHLLSNGDFLNALARIKDYDKTKLQCLRKFMKNTGISQHNLKDTVDAFDVFWTELQIICKAHNVSTAEINTSWSTPKGGNPVVYMERLLTILKNARNLKEQLDCLKELKLDSYGAYYASRYEGFKVVSKEMKLNYEAKIQESLPFNREFQLYRTDWESLQDFVHQQDAWRKRDYFYQHDLYLIKDAPDTFLSIELENLRKEGNVLPFISDKEDIIPPFKLYANDGGNFKKIASSKPPHRDDFYPLAYRFMGQQNKGIAIPTYASDFNKFSKDYWPGMEFYPIIFTSLFFVTHERYKGASLLNLFRNLEKATIHPEVIKTIHQHLIKLYKLDIKLNETEGEVICQRVSMMNSAEFENAGHNKSTYIAQLFRQLQENKYGALKCLEKIAEDPNCKLPFIYALDTADFLSANPIISTTYRDDLLLFSTLINSDRDEIYYKKRMDDKAALVIENLRAVKNFLTKAATEEKPNNLDSAFKILVQSREPFKYAQFIPAMHEIDALPDFDFKAVDSILNNYNFKIKATLPELFLRDNADLKFLMISLIMAIDEFKEKGMPSNFARLMAGPEDVTEAIDQWEKDSQEHAQNCLQRNEENAKELDAKSEELENRKTFLDEKNEKFQTWMMKQAALSGLSCHELQERLNEGWQQAGVALSIVGKAFLMPLLANLKKSLIHNAFAYLPEIPFRAMIIAKISALKDFADGSDFEKINHIQSQASTLASLFNELISRPNFIKHAEALITLFQNADFSALDYVTLYTIVNLLFNMPQRNYVGILTAIFNKEILNNKKKCIELTDTISRLNLNNFPSGYIEKIAEHFTKAPSGPECMHAISELIPAFSRDNDDKLVKFIINANALPFPAFSTIIELTKGIETNRDVIYELLRHLQSDNVQALTTFIEKLLPYNNRDFILEIIAKSFAATPHKNSLALNFTQLIILLANLGEENVEKLHAFFNITTANINCLFDGLKERDPNIAFDVFLNEFEKAPFGKRDFSQQFDVSQVSRVVNESLDLLNQSPYPFDYRKKMMEAFLFVNQSGIDLTVYTNKAAKDLSNAEIKDLFTQIKSGKFNHLDPFQRRLYALGLMREAMYRSTGQFPYSTQIIALIDCLMHKGDVISNIDTGQGKSLIDVMKATLLWLEGDRADISTSSLVDAKRDIALYSPFLSLLGIPHAATPISASSTVEDYQKTGINFSTFSQLSLFFSKARAQNNNVGDETDKVSLVMNESDFSILDDRVIYRYASSSDTSPGIGNDWIYCAINEFVTDSRFKQDDTSEAQDIRALRRHLKENALLNGKSRKLIDKFDDAQLLTWIESAILVNYKLRENFDFILTSEPEVKCINGTNYLTRAAKIVMADGKISPDSQYGNGIQQLLYAKLNSESGSDEFLVEPETTTLLSSNNKNLIDYYRNQNGFIWGSSGTVGSLEEIEEQYSKYGFEFSKIAPHQKNRVVQNKPVISANEHASFDKMIEQIHKNKKQHSAMPDIVFCKDITTAKRLYRYLQTPGKNTNPAQLYTGLGNEEEIIVNAAKPGMITITTSALGRNTDILYDKKIGMNVYDTSIDSLRRAGQKAGRTGRQGSPGEVFYFFSEEDLRERSLKDISTQIDAKSREERAFTEELYDVLDYLFNALDSEDKELKKAWATYYAEVETMYHHLKINHIYTQQSFVRDAVTLFNQKFNQEILVEDVILSLAIRHQRAPEYMAATKKVELSDCISPVFIANHMLQVNVSDASIVAEKILIKSKLESVFSQMENHHYDEVLRNYFTFLNGSNFSQKSISEAHREFLTIFLCETTATSSNRSFRERWFGHESRLMAIANDDNYLLTFKAFLKSENNADCVSLEDMKPAILTLLREYLETGWFINKTRKTACLTLIDTINKASDIDSLIAALADKKLDAIKEDISTNKNSFWRKIKAINASGESRFQNSLDKALALTAALTGKEASSGLLNGLTGALKDVTPTPDALHVFEQHKTLDTYSVATESLRLKDKGNGRVLQTSIERVLQSEKLKKSVAGMVGRDVFFKVDEKGLRQPVIEGPALGA